MIRLHARFRCDLCGKFSAEGVTESEPNTHTAVCLTCIAAALELFVGNDANVYAPLWLNWGWSNDARVARVEFRLKTARMLREGCESSKAVARAVWDKQDSLERDELRWKTGQKGQFSACTVRSGGAEARLHGAGLLTDGDISPWRQFVLSIADVKDGAG